MGQLLKIINMLSKKVPPPFPVKSPEIFCSILVPWQKSQLLLRQALVWKWKWECGRPEQIWLFLFLIIYFSLLLAIRSVLKCISGQDIFQELVVRAWSELKTWTFCDSSCGYRISPYIFHGNYFFWL